MKLKDICFLEGSYDKPRQCIKNQRYHFADKGPYSQSYGFSSSRVQMWELDHKEGWAQKNRCFCIVVLEKTLESPLDCKKIKPVNPKGNQSWIFFGGTDAEAPVHWPLDKESQFIGKDADAGKDWGQEEKEATRMRWLGGIIAPKNMSLSKFQEIVKDWEVWHAAVHGITKGQKWPNSKVTECAQLCVLSHVLLFTTPWTVAHQPPLSIEFSRQEYLSGLLSPTFGKL